MRRCNANRLVLSCALTMGLSVPTLGDAAGAVPQIDASLDLNAEIEAEGFSLPDADSGITPAADAFLGWYLHQRIGLAYDGRRRAVIDVYALLDRSDVRVVAVTDAAFGLSDGTFMHDDSYGKAESSRLMWAARATLDPEIDSFVTIGGAVGPENLTMFDRGWSSCADFGRPRGVGWYVESHDGRHGQPIVTPLGIEGVLVARLATDARCASVEDRDAGFAGFLDWSAGIRWTVDGVEYGSQSDARVAVPTIEPEPGDFNCDERIDGADLAILLDAWGPCKRCAHDLNGDGVVNGVDLGLFMMALNDAAF